MGEKRKGGLLILRFNLNSVGNTRWCFDFAQQPLRGNVDATLKDFAKCEAKWIKSSGSVIDNVKDLHKRSREIEIVRELREQA